MLLQQENDLLHWVNLLECLVSDLVYIPEASHDQSKLFLLFFSFGCSWNDLDSVFYTLNEVLHVGKSLHSVCKQELSELINPIVDDGLQVFDKRLGINSNPANV